MKTYQPTAAELEVLNVLWEHEKGTVRFVHEQLENKKQVTYTTTLKIMQNMHNKSLLSREEEGRGHIYFPAVEKQQTRNKILDKFLESTFGGSSAELVMQLLGNHKTSAEELKEIRRIIDQLEDK